MGSTTTPAPPQVAMMGPMDQVVKALIDQVAALMQAQEKERLMTPQEVADEFGLSKDRVYDLIKKNRIPHTGKEYGDPKIVRSEFIEQARQIARANVTQG